MFKTILSLSLILSFSLSSLARRGGGEGRPSEGRMPQRSISHSNTFRTNSGHYISRVSQSQGQIRRTHNYSNARNRYIRPNNNRNDYYRRHHNYYYHHHYPYYDHYNPWYYGGNMVYNDGNVYYNDNDTNTTGIQDEAQASGCRVKYQEYSEKARQAMNEGNSTLYRIYTLCASAEQTLEKAYRFGDKTLLDLGTTKLNNALSQLQSVQ